jgi:hypothetical protein
MAARLRVSRGVANGHGGEKNWPRGKFLLASPGGKPYFAINPAGKKAGQSGVGLTPSVAFLIKARPEVRKAKAQVSTLRRVGA